MTREKGVETIRGAELSPRLRPNVRCPDITRTPSEIHALLLGLRCGRGVDGKLSPASALFVARSRIMGGVENRHTTARLATLGKLGFNCNHGRGF
jgi:hypothetical protein